MSGAALVFAIVAVAVSGALAVAASESGRRNLVAVFKPLTTILLLGVVGWPTTTFSRFVVMGVMLSVVGDVALLSPSDRAFMAGLAAFLLAHLAYIFAFWQAAVWSPSVIVAAFLTLATSAALLGAIWGGARGLHVPTVLYGLVISGMVIAAVATLGGSLRAAPFAAAGAVLFYVSDASLAINRFRRPIPYASVFTLGIYWIGQVGIALAARSS